MADEHYKWLNRERAERLLRGESLEIAVDAAAHEQAEALSEALGALSAQVAPAAGELPGEQAALAAFRKAREATEAERTAAALADGTPGRRSAATAPGHDAGLIRIGARARTGIRSGCPRWARPVRLALAAAVAAGTLGGVAVAAGTGVLPGPFGQDHPGPAATVSTAQSPDGPLTSASPRTTPGSGSATASPDGGTSGADRDGSGRTGKTDKGTGRGTGKGVPGSANPSGAAGTWWHAATAVCRDLRDGKGLDARRRRTLEGLAGGSTRVSAYCKAVLAASEAAAHDKDGGKDGKGGGKGGDDDSHPGRGGKDKDRDGGKDRSLSEVSPTPRGTSRALAPTLLMRKGGTSPKPSPKPTLSL
ncbi:hypothetical protein [Streptomyces sp. NPDC002676]